MEVGDADSIREFKRAIRQIKEIFLRFTHRYWFHEVSDQVMAKSLYRSCHELIGTDRLYEEIRDEVEEMNTYLDSDSLRRQANMVIRLTVVTIFGLIGTVATGFLGMNLIAAAESPLPTRIFYFMLVFVPTTVLTFYTIIKSKRLADFLDALSDERKSWRERFGILMAVWNGPPDQSED
jgi:Mg2+ and Co2+ transporter CorA